MHSCPTCNFQNRDNAAFCSNCGTSLGKAAALFCSRCGAQNVAGSRFCSACGNPLTGPLPPAGSLTGLLPTNTLLQSRYLILRKLGQGGMGAVYQVNDTRLAGKFWAIKEMSDASLTDPADRANAVAAFQREAQLLANLDHANLPKVSDFFQEQGKHYLVMDFVQGQPLEAVLEATSGFMSEATVLEWLDQLCDVLNYLHTRQPPIIFRDLKPANIMLTPENKIKLIDFGIARLFRPGKSKDTAQFGTIGFASPEQFGTGQTDARSDIYSLGVLLHHLLTRYDPSLTPFNLPPARNINPNISDKVGGVIEQATKAAPPERFQSTKEILDALQAKSSAATNIPIRPAVSPAPAKTQIPYTFAPGKIATTVKELVRLCEQDWDRAVIHFYDGYFATWLESIGEFGLASDAKRIASQKFTSPIEQSAMFYDWLQLTRVSLAPPKLDFYPTALTVDLKLGDLQHAQFALGSIEFSNQGSGIAKGNILIPESWLTIKPMLIHCPVGKKVQVQFTANIKALPSVGIVNVQVVIQSEGGSRILPIKLSNPSGDLALSHTILDFGKIGFFSALFGMPTGPKTIVISSQDQRVLDSLQTWTDEKWILHSIVSRTSERVELNVWIDGSKAPNMPNKPGEIVIESIAGTKIVQVIAQKV